MHRQTVLTNYKCIFVLGWKTKTYLHCSCYQLPLCCPVFYHHSVDHLLQVVWMLIDWLIDVDCVWSMVILCECLSFWAISSQSSEADEDDEKGDDIQSAPLWSYGVYVCPSFFVISSKSSEADEDEPEDEATWDWRSVVVPASTDKVCC